MRKFTRMLLSAVLVLAGLLSVGTASAEKPSGPLKLVWTAEPVESSPDLIDLTFTVSSRRDVSELTLSVELPGSVVLVEGALEWASPADKDEAITLPLRLRVSGEPVEIIGRAAADFSGSPIRFHRSVWTQASSIILNETQAEKPLFRMRQSRDGQAILGIPLR